MEIKSYSAGDEKFILELFQQSFGKPMSQEFWKWRYGSNPFSKDKMIYLMWDGDSLAGHYAISPVELNVGESKVMTGLSMTTMTHPNYVGKGIFTTLADQLYNFIEKQYNVKAVWGFPNLNSHYGFVNKLAWKDIGVIHTLCLYSSNVKFKYHDYFIKNYFEDKHAEKLVTPTFKVSVNKTANYLNWRYFQNPVNDYYLIEVKNNDHWSFVVIKVFDSFKVKGKKEIDILEIGTEDSKSIIDLVGGIIKFCDDRNIDWLAINTWLNIVDERHSILERMGFILDSPVSIISHRLFHESAHNMLNIGDWNFSMGDSDVY